MWYLYIWEVFKMFIEMCILKKLWMNFNVFFTKIFLISIFHWTLRSAAICGVWTGWFPRASEFWDSFATESSGVELLCCAVDLFSILSPEHQQIEKHTFPLYFCLDKKAIGLWRTDWQRHGEFPKFTSKERFSGHVGKLCKTWVLSSSISKMSLSAYSVLLSLNYFNY